LLAAKGAANDMALLRPGPGNDLKRPHAFVTDLMAPLLLAVLLAAAVWGIHVREGAKVNPVYLGVVVCFAAALVYNFSWRPVRFGLGVAALIAAGLMAVTFAARAKLEGFGLGSPAGRSHASLD
jgi:hypothetical protein